MSGQLTVRVAGLGTWRLPRWLLADLNRFDTEIEEAVAVGDGARATRFLKQLVANVTEQGEPVTTFPDEASDPESGANAAPRVDLELPSSAATLEQLEKWLANTPLEDGFLPD